MKTQALRSCTSGLAVRFSTILPFYRRWQEQHSLADKAETDLSPEFQQAILAEFGRITLKTSQQLIAQLNVKSEELSEAQKLLADHESEVDRLTETLALQQQKADQERLRFEKELSALQALIEAGAKREIALQNQMETLRQTLHAAELKTAVAEALYQKK